MNDQEIERELKKVQLEREKLLLEKALNQKRRNDRLERLKIAMTEKAIEAPGYLIGILKRYKKILCILCSALVIAILTPFVSYEIDAYQLKKKEELLVRKIEFIESECKPIVSMYCKKSVFECAESYTKDAPISLCIENAKQEFERKIH